jgi:hypothetical protein
MLKEKDILKLPTAPTSRFGSPINSTSLLILSVLSFNFQNYINCKLEEMPAKKYEII